MVEDLVELKKDIELYLKNYFNFSNVSLVKRGNKAIDLVLKFLKNKGFNKLFIPREGGWLHYPRAAKKFKFDLYYINTVDSKIVLDDFSSLDLDEKSVVLYNSLGGYFVAQDVVNIYNIAKEKKAEVILDITSSIGLRYFNSELEINESIKFADFCVSSLGKEKPVDAEGGLVLYKNNNFKEMLDYYFSSNFLGDLFDYDFLLILKNKLENLKDRILFLLSVTKKIIFDLRKLNISLLSDNYSFVVIALFSNVIERQKIIDYCNKNNFQFTICPREIRILRDAISIEVKRLKKE